MHTCFVAIHRIYVVITVTPCSHIMQSSVNYTQLFQLFPCAIHCHLTLYTCTHVRHFWEYPVVFASAQPFVVMSLSPETQHQLMDPAVSRTCQLELSISSRTTLVTWTIPPPAKDSSVPVRPALWWLLRPIRLCVLQIAKLNRTKLSESPHRLN